MTFVLNSKKFNIYLKINENIPYFYIICVQLFFRIWNLNLNMIWQTFRTVHHVKHEHSPPFNVPGRFKAVYDRSLAYMVVMLNAMERSSRNEQWKTFMFTYQKRENNCKSKLVINLLLVKSLWSERLRQNGILRYVIIASYLNCSVRITIVIELRIFCDLIITRQRW
jgi:hypothetical protein